MTERGELPEHARAIAEWLHGDSAVDAGWIEAHVDHAKCVVTLHVPTTVHTDRQEILAFRAGMAVRRFDPDVAGVDIRFAPFEDDDREWRRVALS